MVEVVAACEKGDIIKRALRGGLRALREQMDKRMDAFIQSAFFNSFLHRGIKI